MPFLSREAATELNSWSVVLGSLQREGLSPGAEEVGVAAVHLPKAYNHYSQGSDLALLRLAHPTAHTPLCLPQSSHHFSFGASCWATGWDQDTNDGKHYARLSPERHSSCPRSHSHSFKCPGPISLASQSLDSGLSPHFFIFVWGGQGWDSGLCAC